MFKKSILVLTAGLFWSTVTLAQPVILGPLDARNNLSEIAGNGSAAQGAARGNLGLGSIATQGANAAAITGGTVNGLSSLGTSGAINLTGSGTNTYDGQIRASGGGSVAGEGTNSYEAGFHMFKAYDNTPQFGIGYQLGSVEYWSAMGGALTMGGTFYASNGTTTGNVDGNFAAQNQGQFWFGNGSGNLFSILDPGGSTGAYIQIKPSNGQATTGGATAAIVSTGDLALIPSGGANRITVNIPDGSNTNGNNRGSGAIDLMFIRSTAYAVCSGPNSFCAGSNNVGSGSNAFVSGFSNICDGAWCSMPGGQDGAINGRYGLRAYSNGIFAQQGDAETVDGNMRGTSVSGAAIRLTANSTTATNNVNAPNCDNLPVGKTAAMNLTLVGVDQNNTAKTVAWFNKAILSRPASTTMAYAQGTAITLGTDTVTVVAVADTTNECLSFTVTPDNTDTWHFSLSHFDAEVQ